MVEPTGNQPEKSRENNAEDSKPRAPDPKDLHSLEALVPPLDRIPFDEVGLFELKLPEGFDFIEVVNFNIDFAGEGYRNVEINFRDGFQHDLRIEYADDPTSIIRSVDGVRGVYKEDKEVFHVDIAEDKSIYQTLALIEQAWVDRARPYEDWIRNRRRDREF